MFCSCTFWEPVDTTSDGSGHVATLCILYNLLLAQCGLLSVALLCWFAVVEVVGDGGMMHHKHASARPLHVLFAVSVTVLTLFQSYSLHCFL